MKSYEEPTFKENQRRLGGGEPRQEPTTSLKRESKMRVEKCVKSYIQEAIYRKKVGWRNKEQKWREKQKFEIKRSSNHR